MENISFESGYKEYSINNDENAVIRVYTKDYGMLDRIKKSLKNIEKLAEEYKSRNITNNDEANDFFVEVDSKIRNEINTIFDSDVSSIVFGNTNCLSICNDGNLLFENFINAAIPVIRRDLQEGIKKNSKNVDKYVSQAKRFSK